MTAFILGGSWREKPVVSPRASVLDWNAFLEIENGLSRITRRRPGSGVVLDLRRVEQVYVPGIVPLIAHMNRFRAASGATFTVIAPEAQRTRDYFSNQHWLYYLSPSQYPMGRKTSSFALRTFSTGDELNDVVNGLQAIVAERLKFAEGVHTALDWTLNEVADNVLNHSKADGYLQVMPDGPRSRLNVVVFDTGTGIPDSLRSAIPGLGNDLEALRHAIKKGVTRNPELGQGNGLWGAVAIAQASKGALHINSGRGHLSVANSELHTNTIRTSVVGTVVSFQFDTMSPIDLPRILGHLPYNYILEGGLSEGDVADIDVAGFAANFGNRATGQKLRVLIWNSIQSRPGHRIRISMGGIPVVSSSFADEAFAKLVQEIGIMDFTQSVELVDMDPLVKNLIDSAINQRIREST